MARIKAIGVIRVSTARQADQDHFGVPAQQAAITELGRQYDLDIVETVSYNDVSGADVMYAPEMRRVLQLIARPDVGAVVAKEFSRLVRPGFEDYPLLQKFVEAHITLYLPSGPVDLSNEHGRFFATIQAAMASLELHTIKTRMMSGREESRKRGYCAAGGRTLPTGFLWDVKTKKYSHDPDYLPNVLEAFRMVDEGETSFQHIINKLRLYLRPDNGVPKLATPSCLRRLLQNRMYIGERVIDKKFDMSVPKEKLLYVGKDGRLHRRNRPTIPREPNEIIIREVMPPVVNRDRFERVQAILKAKSDKRHQSHTLHQNRETFIYRGLLFCGECGEPLYTVSTAPGRAYYRCRDNFRRRGGTGKCCAPSMRKDLLEAEIDRVFSREFTRAHFLTKLLKQHVGTDSRKALLQRRKQLRARQDALAKQRERIIDLEVTGRICRDNCDRRLKVVDDEIGSNRLALAELIETPLPSYAEWQRLFRPFLRGFSGLPVGEKRSLVASRFQQIKVRDYRVISLYLLTGGETEPKPPIPEVEQDPTKCISCGRNIRQDIRDSIAPYCLPCSEIDPGAEEEAARTDWERDVYRDQMPFVQVAQPLSDSYLGL